MRNLNHNPQPPKPCRPHNPPPSRPAPYSGYHGSIPFLHIYPWFLRTYIPMVVDPSYIYTLHPRPPCALCSSTPATVGAIAGVGLWEGRSGFNGRLLAKFVAGWVVTIVAAVLLTCAFMAQGLYSPNKYWCVNRSLCSFLFTFCQPRTSWFCPPKANPRLLRS